ncbi:MAG: carboxypeptidase regulatory-like domain-containing protein [Lachnospiraceae bacterium]|nr:carboxypeptidase regulatory-like domain-containing protein [Lachnospiraceae bacterium]
MTRMKRRVRSVISLFLCIVLMTGLIPESLMGTLFVHAEPAGPSGEWTDYVEEITFFWEGNNKIYEISTPEQLAWMAAGINGGTLSQAESTFRLVADIDLSAHYWTPIGPNDDNKICIAPFEGNGHTISGMYIGSEDAPYNASAYVGLFGYAQSIVSNLKICDSVIYANAPSFEQYVGLLVGGAKGTGTIKGCEISGQIFTNGSLTPDKGAMGGLAGYITRTVTVDSCRTEVTLGALDSSRKYYYGGIAGVAGPSVHESINVKIQNCVSSVTVSLPDGTSSANIAGGAIVGYSKADASCSIKNCFGIADHGGAGLSSDVPVSTGAKTNVITVDQNFKRKVNSAYVTQSPAYTFYGYSDGEGADPSEMTEAEIKDPDFVQQLNVIAGDTDLTDPLSWSIDENVNNGFPNLADAGMAVTYTVTFMSLGENYKTVSVLGGQAVASPADPENGNGKTFLYWYSDNPFEAYDFSTPVTSDLTLTAKWQGIEYLVRYDSLGGSYVYPQTLDPGEKATIPAAPTKKGYVFDGWYKDTNYAELWNFDTAVYSDITLYAKWSKASDVSISGRITDAATGDGIRNATVTLTGGKNATTDEFGYYRIADVSSGSYTITARAFGYNDASEAGFTVAGVSKGFDAALSKTADGNTSTVNIYATISCVYSGIMLDGVVIKAIGEGNLGTYTQTTSNGGLATFTGIPAGNYTFQVNHSGRGGWESYTSAKTSLSGDYQLNCALKPNYQALKINVIGTFDPKTNKANAPLKGKEVALIGVDPKDEDNELINIPAYTGDDGSVTVQKLVPITWKISCSDYAYEEDEVTVTSDGKGKLSEDEVTLTLPFIDSSLSVNLDSIYEDDDLFKRTEENEDTLPVVLLSGVAGTMTEGIVRSDRPDASGKVLFTGLFPGNYNLSASGRVMRVVDIKSKADNLEIFSAPHATYDPDEGDFSRFGRKHFDVDFNGTGTGSVALGIRSSVTLDMDPSPVNFSGILYKTDMDENGAISSEPLNNAKLIIKPSAYYPQRGVDDDGYEITTDSTGHYSITMAPGLYGVEMESTYDGYFGGKLTYHEGNSDGYEGPWGWPCTGEWKGTKASAVAWMTGDERLAYGDIGGMGLSSGTVVADLEIMEKKINYSACNQGNPVSYGNLATQNLIIGSESAEEITHEDRSTIWNNYDYYENSYTTINFRPDTRGATLKLTGDKKESVSMTGKSFPYVFNELSHGDYGLEYIISDEFSQLQSSVSWGGDITFFDFPAPGKLPDSFPEDYASNNNPWPLTTKYSGLKIEAKSGKKTFQDIHDSIGFKFWHLNYYGTTGTQEPVQPENTVNNPNTGSWKGIPQSKWEEVQAEYADRDLHWRWDTGELGDNLSEAVYNDTYMPTESQYYHIVYNDEVVPSPGYGSRVIKPTSCSYPQRPTVPNDEDHKAVWDKFDADLAAFQNAYSAAVAKYKEDYAAWYQNAYVNAGFPKAGALYCAPEGDGSMPEGYEDASNILFEKYLVAYSTSKIPDKLFYYHYTNSNRSKPLPDGEVKLYFCAPRGKGYVFLNNLQYIRHRENLEELYNTDLWFSVTIDKNNETTRCSVDFLHPAGETNQSSSNVTIYTAEQIRNLLNPRTIVVKAIESGDPEKILNDVAVTITYAGKEFSSASSTAQQTCTGEVTRVEVPDDQYEWECRNISQVVSTYDDANKTQTFYVPFTRKNYSQQFLVKDDAGNPIPGASITITGESVGQPLTVFTSASGTATVIERLTYQDYDVHVTAQGYSFHNIPLTAEEVRSDQVKNDRLTRCAQPEFTDDSVTINRKGAFIPGINFAGSSNSIDFLVDALITDAKDKPLYYTVNARLQTAVGDSLLEVFLIDKRSFENADFSDVPEALATPAMDEQNYNPTNAWAWGVELEKGELGNVYYRRLSGGETFVPKEEKNSCKYYEIEKTLPLWELPPDGFEPCLLAVTSNHAMQIYDFDYSGEAADDQLVGIRISGERAAILKSITLMANGQALGGPALEKLAEISEPVGSIIPMMSFEAGIEEEDGFLSYEYTLEMELLSGKKSVSDAEKSYMAILPSTLGIMAKGGYKMSLDGEERKLSSSFNVTVAGKDLDAKDYLPSAFNALPVKVEFDEDNPPSGTITLAAADTKDKNNNNTVEEYSLGVNGQVHIVAEVSAFSSFAAVLPVGPVLASLEKSGALDIGAKIQVAVGADGTYKYKIINGEEVNSEHEVEFTLGAGAGIGFYAKAFGGALGAEANLKLTGDNDKLEDMVTVSASIGTENGFKLNRIDGKVVADAHIEMKTWFINGEKDFKFAEIPFSYQFGTETQFSLTRIDVVDNIKSRNDFTTSTFNGQPESIVSNLLPIGGYAADEDGSGTFVYTDMSAKGGKVRLQFAAHAGGTSWSTPITITSTAGLIPACDVISLTDGEYMIVWSEIAKGDMMMTCPPSVIRYSVGKISGNTWTGSIKTLSNLSSEVASKLLLVSEGSDVRLVALTTAEGAMAEHLSISGYKYASKTWSGAVDIAKDQETYSIAACVKDGAMYVSYVTADFKLHVKKWAASVTENLTDDASGFETALAADDDYAYLVSETKVGLMLRRLSGSSWGYAKVIDDIPEPGNPSLAIVNDKLAVSFTAGNDRSLYLLTCTQGGVVLEGKNKLSTSTDRFSDCTTIRSDNKILVMTVVDGTTDRLNVYSSDGSARQPAAITAAPKAVADLFCNGNAQELISAGSAKGGTIYYALTTVSTAPADNLYTSSIPTAVDAGTYYVWYKVVGDAGHYDTAPSFIKVVIGEKPATPEPEPEEPVTPAVPEPEVIDAVHAINVMTGASVKNSKGEEVKTAKENEMLSVSWENKEGYEFEQWEITGAVPESKVSENTAFMMGTTDVTVAYKEKLKAEDQINEELPADADTTTKINSLKFEKTKLTLEKNTAATANPAKAEASGGTLPEIVYVTGNKDIVAVDKAGNFYPVGNGETTVTAYCGNKKASCKVTVVSYTKDIIVRDMSEAEVSSLEMKSGEQTFLTVSFDPYDSTDPRNITWKSNNKKVTVKNGIVTAREVTQEVNAEISISVKVTDAATGKTNKTLTKTVKVRVTPITVEKPANTDKTYTLSLKKKTLKMVTTEGKDSFDLGITVTPKKNADVSGVKILSVSSSNPDVVVSGNAAEEFKANGKKYESKVQLKAVGTGTAYIYVKTVSADGKQNMQRCKVSVTSPATAIAVKSGSLSVSDKNTIQLRKGEKGTVEVSLIPGYSTDLNKLKISGSGGITVKNGVIFAKKITKGKPAKLIVRCGKLKQVVEVTVTK